MDWLSFLPLSSCPYQNPSVRTIMSRMNIVENQSRKRQVQKGPWKQNDFKLSTSSLTLDSTKHRIWKQSSLKRKKGVMHATLSSHVIFRWNTLMSRSIHNEIRTIWKEGLLTIIGTLIMVNISRKTVINVQDSDSFGDVCLKIFLGWTTDARKLRFHGDLAMYDQMYCHLCQETLS